MSDKKQEARNDMIRGLSALYIQVPEAVADDVGRLFAALADLLMESRIEPIDYDYACFMRERRDALLRKKQARHRLAAHGGKRDPNCQACEELLEKINDNSRDQRRR